MDLTPGNCPRCIDGVSNPGGIEALSNVSGGGSGGWLSVLSVAVLVGSSNPGGMEVSAVDISGAGPGAFGMGSLGRGGKLLGILAGLLESLAFHLLFRASCLLTAGRLSSDPATPAGAVSAAVGGVDDAALASGAAVSTRGVNR